MKIDKQKKIKLAEAIKTEAKKRKYKFRQGLVFYTEGKYFIYCMFYLTNLDEIEYYVKIKEIIYDDIFWEIMNMEGNKNEPLSLRACGAFSAYSLELFKGNISYREDLEVIAETVLSNMETAVNEFIGANELDEYIVSRNIGADDDFLKCIVYIKRKEFDLAKEIAIRNIEKDDWGGFMNRGKTFYEYVLDYIK